LKKKETRWRGWSNLPFYSILVFRERIEDHGFIMIEQEQSASPFPSEFSFSQLRLDDFRETSVIFDGDGLTDEQAKEGNIISREAREADPNNNKLVLDMSGPQEQYFSISEKGWGSMWMLLERLDAWDKWQGDFVNKGIMDGDSWSLHIIHGEREIKCNGQNALPPGFDEFFALLNFWLAESLTL